MPNTEQLALEGHHKVYSSASPVVDIPRAHILGGADPTLHGLVLMKPGAKMPRASVRHPFFRTIEDDSQVHLDDLVPLYAYNLGPDELNVPPHFSLTAGSETEVFTLHEEVRNNGHERIQPFWTSHPLEAGLKELGIPYSPETWAFMLETNGLASTSTLERAKDFRRTAKALHQATELGSGELKFLPISSQPFEVNPDNINSHPYVQRIVGKYLTFEKTQDLGASFQVHVEMLDINSAIFAVNALRKIPHLFMATALNGPFTQHRYTGLLSAREEGRRRLGTAGNMPELPEWNELLERSVTKMQTEPLPSLTRAISQHSDFRIRPDISPHGTIEFMFLDNPGGNVDKMLMAQELFRLSTWRLYHAHLDSEDILPITLFGQDFITQNKKAVESMGADAIVKNGLGNPTTIHSQMAQLLKWVKHHQSFQDNPEYPFAHLEAEVQKSLTTPDLSTPTLASMDRFYQTGIGTPGHYQKAFYEHLRDHGHSETAAINMTLVNYSDGYHGYISQLAA